MPRRSSGGRSALLVPRRAAAPPVPRHAPAQNPPPQPGMELGIGIAIVNAVLGPRTIEHEHKAVVWQAAVAPAPDSGGYDACGLHSKAFQDCMNINGTYISKYCQFYMDKLAECKRNSDSVMSS